MAYYGKHNGKSSKVVTAIRVAVLVLSVVSLIVIGYYTADLFF